MEGVEGAGVRPACPGEPFAEATRDRVEAAEHRVVFVNPRCTAAGGRWGGKPPRRGPGQSHGRDTAQTARAPGPGQDHTFRNRERVTLGSSSCCTPGTGSQYVTTHGFTQASPGPPRPTASHTWPWARAGARAPISCMGRWPGPHVSPELDPASRRCFSSHLGVATGRRLAWGARGAGKPGCRQQLQGRAPTPSWVSYSPTPV